MKFDINYFVYPVWFAIAEVHKTGWESKKIISFSHGNLNMSQTVELFP